MKFRSSTTLFLSLLILSVSILIAESDSDDECVYAIYIQTGSGLFDGTNSNIGAQLYTLNGSSIEIPDLVSWGGLLGHHYFASGNLDIFAGRGSCLAQPICALNLTSDGSGFLPAWYCEFFEITSVGLNITSHTHHFTINQWLAPDLPDASLYAYRNDCNDDEYSNGNGNFNGVIKSVV